MSIESIDAKIVEAAKKVRLLLLDCDGVLTDGRLYFSESGESLKVFHARDGQGIVHWHKAGFHSGIISGRNSKIVELRGGQLGIEFIFQGRKEKVSAFLEVIAAAGVQPEETAFVGDDTPDAEVMRYAGFAVAVADAHKDVKVAAHYVTENKGGRGAVREVIDLLLRYKQT